jgi:spermidine synthase
MKNALRKEGIAVTQCESMYLHKEVISGVSSFASEIFPLVSYYFTLVPTYPSGIIGFLFNSLKWDPQKNLSVERAERLNDLKYYSSRIHKAAFTLPQFGEQLIKGK